MASVKPLISVDWLADSLGRGDLKVVDGTWLMPGAENPLPGHFIPGAQTFDIDAVADTASHMTHMLPPADVFENAMSAMGILETDTLIIYDRHGIRAAPRVWWTCRMFGHETVSILDGGLPAWIAAGHDTDNEPLKVSTPSVYKAGEALTGVISQSEILSLLGTDIQILDARPAGRFYGTTPEPRAGMRSGHIPGSRSWPLSDLLTSGGHMKPLEEIISQIEALGIDLLKPVITSCGSGVTAAGLAFALHRAGAANVSVYDGSWTEWGASDAPVSLKAPQ